MHIYVHNLQKEALNDTLKLCFSGWGEMVRILKYMRMDMTLSCGWDNIHVDCFMRFQFVAPMWWQFHSSGAQLETVWATTVLVSEYILRVENCFAKEQLWARRQSILAPGTPSYFPSTSRVLAGLYCSVWGQRKRHARWILADFHVSFKCTVSVFGERENSTR